MTNTINKTLILIASIAIIFLASCNSDRGTKKSISTNEKAIEESTILKDIETNFDSNSVDKVVILEDFDAEDDEKDKKELENTTKKLVEEKAKLKKKKIEVAKEKIKNSKLKGKSCDEIIEKYKQVLAEFEKTKNIELLNWKNTNDPIFQSCYQKNKVIFDSLERIENELGSQLDGDLGL